MSVVKHVKQLGTESIIYGISGTIAQGIGIFLIPIYTRIFSPSEFGVIALVRTLTSLLGMFVVLGLDSSSARWFYDTDETQDRKYTISSWFWCQLTTSCIIALILLLIAPHVADLLLKSEAYAILIIIAAITIPLETFNRVLGNWLRYQRRAWTTTIFSTTSSVGTIGIIVLFVVAYRWGLVGIYSARLIAAMVIALIVISIMRSWINPAYFSWSRLREMLSYGLPLVPAAIASWTTLSSDRFILQIFHDTSEVGLYSLAATLASGVALFTGAFQMAWGPFAYSILKEEDSIKVYSKVFSLYSLGGCFLCTVVTLFASQLVSIFATPKYYQAATCIPYLTFAHVGAGITYIFALGSGIVKKSNPIALSIFIGAGTNVALNFVLIPNLGKEGAAISTLIAYICGNAYLYRASQKNYHIPYHLKDVLFCFGFSWILILIGQIFIPTWGVFGLGLRAMMCSLFIPLALWLKIVKLVDLKRLFYYATKRLGIAAS